MQRNTWLLPQGSKLMRLQPQPLRSLPMRQEHGIQRTGAARRGCAAATHTDEALHDGLSLGPSHSLIKTASAGWRPVPSYQRLPTYLRCDFSLSGSAFL
jgi:hypothetical protein